jgi:hypothetical protein
MQNADFMARLDRVKQKHGWTWEQTARSLELSRSMLHFVKTSKYPVSEKAAKRLRKLEAEAGIVPRAQAIIEAIAREMERTKPKISKSDIEAGVTEVEVRFVSGEPPAGCDNKVQLTRPSIKTRAKLVGDLLVEESYHPVLLACLPPDKAHDSFLNQLTPFSYNALAEAAMTLVFGPDWQQEVPDLAE